MLIAYWFLLLLYLGLTLLYIFTHKETPTLSPWPLLTSAPPDPQIITSCQVDADCTSSHYVCLGTTCVPKLLRGGECNPEHGQWISFVRQQASFAICSCLRDHLFTQKVFGGDCDVNVGCGVHGHYVQNSCQCEPGYEAVGLTCLKLPVIEQLKESPCEENEIPVLDIKPKDGFYAQYVALIHPAACIKRPCSFDALSGRPLKKTKYDPEWGCVCDPRYGQFGVHLEGQGKTYLHVEGFDACASLFLKEPPEPINVKIITYFYLGDREPVSLLLYENLKDEDLIPTFRGRGGQVMIRQAPWRYDYAQYYIKEKQNIRMRTRKLYKSKFFEYETVNNNLYVDDVPEICSVLMWQYRWLNRPNDTRLVYELLYSSPVCMTTDAETNPEFRERYIVNPNQITFQSFPTLPRFNAFVLEYDAAVGIQQWTLYLDYPFEIDRYRFLPTNAPHY